MMMKQKIRTVFGVLAIVAVVLIAGCTTGNQTPCTEEAKICPDGSTVGRTGPNCEFAPCPGGGAKTVNVAIADSGFEPEVLAINSGDTVVWTSNKDSGAWPASDDHPTHTKLPGFDALKGLSKDQTYRFTFTKAGTWGYHDHLHPNVIGNIIVK